MPRSFPTPWVAYLHRYSGSTENDEGRTVDAWTPAKTATGIPFRVITWAPVVTQDVGAQGNQPLIRYELFVPPDLVDTDGNPLADPGPRDVIDLPEDNPFGIARFEVQGWPRDYTHGFHGWPAGKVIDLQRT